MGGSLGWMIGSIHARQARSASLQYDLGNKHGSNTSAAVRVSRTGTHLGEVPSTASSSGETATSTGRRATRHSGALERAEGAIHQAKGRVHQAKGRVHQAKGRVHQAKGRVHQAKGGVHQAKGGVDPVATPQLHFVGKALPPATATAACIASATARLTRHGKAATAVTWRTRGTATLQFSA